MSSGAEPAGPHRDREFWSRPVDRLGRPDAPDADLNLNVAGRRVAGPVQGFGRLWQKTYRVDLGDGSTPAAVVEFWKQHFGELWPPGNRFYGPLTGLAPGEVALLNLSMPGGIRLSTGVLVLYADAESFTLMTPEGHQFAGWITFSAETTPDGGTAAQAQVLMRASDPLYELGLALGGHRMEDRFWVRTLEALADRLGVPAATVAASATCVDRHRQWRRSGNLRANAAVRSTLYRMRGPFHRR